MVKEAYRKGEYGAKYEWYHPGSGRFEGFPGENELEALATIRKRDSPNLPYGVMSMAMPMAMDMANVMAKAKAKMQAGAKLPQP